MKNTLIVWLAFAILLGLLTKSCMKQPETQPILENQNKTFKQETKVDRQELLCLAKNVYFEARGEPISGKQAVAQVVLNRMDHPAFPKTACGVVNQKTKTACQFSWVCEPKRKVNVNSPAWGDSVWIAKKALTNKNAYDKFSSTVLYFHEKHLPFDWNHKYQKVKVIGNHVFYRIKYAHERGSKTIQLDDRGTGTQVAMQSY